ncbi:leucine-rich repeat domain-containing protein [Alistipes sp.]|uniref:leucine-rich repeat domain-containing protein n=1 Tax=Alistipes sp. TaxID=1872444 RepID=UPI003AB1D204
MLPEGSGSPVYAPYSIRAGSIGDDGRTALFEGGLSWQSPASTHTFYAYYAGAASGIELDGATGHLLLPDISSQEQSGTESAHVGKANVMIAHPLTVTSPAEGETAFFNFSFSHLYPLLEFRIADFGNPNNSILESVTLESLKAGESPAWESASVNVKLTSPDEGYLTLTPGGVSKPITLSVTGDEAARTIPTAATEDFRSAPALASDAPEVSGAVFIARMAIQPCDLSRTPEQLIDDSRNMRIVVKARESEIPYEYEFRNPGIRFEGGKRYVSTLVLKAAEGRAVIHVDTPETLVNKFGADARQAPSMKITGTINASDFFTIASLTYLRHLDLSEVKVAAQQDIGFGYFPPDTIPEYALNNMPLESIALPTSIAAIGDEAFAICQSLTGDLVIPSGVLSIGNRAFLYCPSLTGTLTIPASVTWIGDMAFADCPFSAVRLLNPEPIFHSQDMFSTGMTFYVPRGSRDDYQAAEGWKNNEYTFIED